MVVNNVSFNEKWVKSFISVEEFINHPSNQHLFPEAKTKEERDRKLTEVFAFFNPKFISNDVRNNGHQSRKARRSQDSPGDSTKSTEADGGTEQKSDVAGAGFEGETDNLSGAE